MMLVINTGSSSVKFKLYKNNGKLLEVFSGSIDNIASTEKEFVKAAMKILSELNLYINDIKVVAYRVVHSGGVLKDGVRATDSVVEHILKFDKLAPLHNLRAALIIQSLKEILPKALHLCYFDTTFYQSLPKSESIYPINSAISEKFNLRRYGFHGISHQFAYSESRAKSTEKVISIHLGAGCSVTAISGGKAVATSMGFTPLSGIVMQTRSGDIDPGLVLYLAEMLGIKGTQELLSNKSGLAGLTDSSGSMLDVLYLAGEKIEEKNYTPLKELRKSKKSYDAAQLSLDIYCNSIIKYIGSYSALMGGVDRVIIGGKIGFGSSVIRRKILSRIKFLKIKKINIVDSNEELAIAKKVK
jgi:acetate kinase